MLTRDETRIFLKYLHPYRMQIAKISALAVICAFFEAINLAALVPLLQMLNTSQDTGGEFRQILVQIFSYTGIEFNFINLLMAMGALFLIGQILFFIKKKWQAGLWFKFSSDLKRKIFSALLESDISYHYNEKSGKFIDILSRQTEYAATSVFGVTEILSFLFLILVYVAMLVYMSPPLTIICLVISIICLLLLNYLIKKSREIGIRSNDTSNRMNELISERLSLVKLIKIFSTEDVEARRIHQITDEYSRNSTAFWMNGVKIETIFQVIIFTLALCILYISTLILNLPLAMLLVFIFILIRLTDPLRQINSKRHEIAGQLASLEMIDKTLTESDKCHTINSGGETFDHFEHGIEVNHIWFSCTQDSPVIKDVTFSIGKDEMLALVGASGGGKSTLIDLIMRLIEPEKGEIRIDGKNLRDLDIRQYHRKVGFVSQDSYLFNDSVINNICYGSNVDIEKAIAAATITHAHDFITQLPKGYNTDLGERGVKLSGGQKQRIALARALYKDPEILILDEATSALDSEAEKVIQQAIMAIRHKYTIIAIAHRLSTIENADRIITIENGTVVEMGTHKDLVAAGGAYARYYAIQYNPETVKNH